MSGQTSPLPGTIRRKLTRRIAWFCMALFIFSYIDRANVSLVAGPMNRDLGLSAAAYGLGASIFFLGYAFFEIPSNALLYRFGARVWLGRITITWGIIASLMAIIGGTTGFYTLRFLLGVAEAGFQPGVVFYLSRWFPNRERAHAISVFNTAGPLAIAFGAPITGLLLGATDGAFGIAGWRWTFFLEGLPSILLGVTTLFYLPDRPATATWLKPEERLILSDILDTEQAAQAQRDQSWFGWLRNPRILALAFVFFLLACGNYGVIFWLPQIVSGFGHLSSMQIGIITAIPFLSAALCMRVIARWSDRTGYRGSLVALCCLLAGLGFLGSAYAGSPIVSLLCLSLVTTAIWSSFSPFWTLTGGLLSGPGTATGLAFVDSIGQFGGLLAPYTVGLIRDATGSYQLALVGMAVPCLLAALVTALTTRR